MKKLSSKITLAVLIVLIIGLAGLYFIVSNSVYSTTASSAKEKMMEAVKTRVNMTEEYIRGVEETVITYAQTGIFKTYCQQKNGTIKKGDALYDPNADKVATDYLIKIKENVFPGRFEGIWAADKDTKMFAHSNDGAVGAFLREDEDLRKQLFEQLESVGRDSVLNVGIRKAATSDDMLLVIYYPIRDEDDTIIGVTGCGAFTQPLVEQFNSNPIEGMENATYYMLDLDNDTYIFNSEDASKVGAELDKGFLGIAERAKSSNTESDSWDFIDEDTKKAETVVYKKIEGHNWIFVLKDSQAEINAPAVAIANTILIICVIVAVVLAIATFVIISWMTKGLPVIAGAIERFGHLDLQVKGELEAYLDKKDEVGQMARASRGMAVALRNSVGKLAECRDNIGTTAGTLGGATQELSDCVANNAATTEQLFASISNTNQSVETVENAVTNVFDSIEDVTKKVDNSDEITKSLMEKSKQIKSEATTSLEKGSENINRHKERVEEAVTSLKAIEKVNVMVNEILEITRQTNLLSLNASIEAARAGDAGKGFAVVAMEISQLADQSAATANKIQDIVRDSNVSIENVRKCFAEIIDYMENDILQNFKEFAQAADEYGEQSDQIGEQIDEITDSMQQLKRYMQEIVESSKNVSEAARQNEQAVTEIVEKNENMINVSDRVSEISDTNNENSTQIGDVVNQFKL